MTFIFKEFGLGIGQAGLTKFIYKKEVKNNNETVFALFFEWITPQIDASVFNNIVTISFNKFLKQKKFKNGLHAFANYLLFLAKSENYEEIDINFVLVKITKNNLFIAKFGDVDIFIFNKDTKSIYNLYKHIPVNSSLTSLKYLKTSNILSNILLFSNYKILSNLIDSSLIETTSVVSLFNSLTNLKNNVLDSKLVVVIGDLNLQLEQEEDVDKIHNNMKIGKNLFNNSYRNLTKVKDKLQDITNIKNDVLIKINPYFSRAKKILSNIKIAVINVLHNVTVYLMNFVASLLFKNKKYNKVNRLQQAILYQDVNNLDKYSENIKDKSNEIIEDSQKNSLDDQEIDPLIYFKLKRTFLGKIKLFFIKLQIRIKKSKKPKFLKSKLFNNSKFLGKKLFLILGVVILGFITLLFLILQYKHVKRLKDLDKQYLHIAESSINDIASLIGKIQQSSDIQKDIKLFSDCDKKYKNYNLKLNGIKEKVNFVQTKQYLNNKREKLHELYKQCHILYNQVFKIKTLNFTELKDFKASFGQSSHITNVNVYKGILVVVDNGRKVIYQVNPENGKVIKLKDPTGKLKDPYKVSFGEAQGGTPIIFVCDRQNGILFYDANNGFSTIPGTDSVAMGASCTSVGGFGTKAYFTTERGDAIYKLINIGGGYAFPKPYISLSKSIKILDFAIDGSIYVLGQYPAQGGYLYDIVKFFGGKKDNFILSKADKMRLKNPTMIYTNPSGYKPLYILDNTYKNIYVMEKPTSDKHAGIGVFIKTYDLSNLGDGNITGFAVNLGVNNNKEDYIYVVANDKLFKARLK